MSSQTQIQTRDKTTIFDLVHKVYLAYVKASRKEELSKQVRELVEKVGANCNGCQIYDQWDPEQEQLVAWIGIESVREKLEEVTKWLGARSYSIMAIAPYKCERHVYSDEEKKLRDQLKFETCGGSDNFDIILTREGEAAIIIRFFYDTEEDP